MEITDYTLIISTVIVVSGWFVNSHLNRRHDISKKRMDCRLETLLSFLPVFLSMQQSSQPFIDDPDLNDKIRNAFVKFQLYGYQDEVDLFLDFKTAVENQEGNKVTERINSLIELVRTRLRDELKLPTLSLK